MKKIRLISTSFEEGKNELIINTPLVFKDYTIDLALYNNTNTPSRAASLQSRTKCKIYKMMEWLEYPDYDYYIWVNSKFVILDGFFENMFAYESDEDAELFLFNHHMKSSIRSEMDFMKDHMERGDSYVLSRYGGDVMEEQVNKYLANEDYKDDLLFDGGLFMYSRKLVENKEQNFMIDWFLHNVLYSVQDQLWLPYLVKKHKVNFRVYDKNLFNNDFLGFSG